MQTTLDTPAISRNFTAILDSLSEKESIVISRRMGLHGNKSTLQAIGDEFQITRERVRQIEETAIRKIGRVTRSNNLFAIQEIANNILAKAGGERNRNKRYFASRNNRGTYPIGFQYRKEQATTWSSYVLCTSKCA